MPSGSVNSTCLLDFRDGYYAWSGLLDHVNNDRFDDRSDRLLRLPRVHFPSGFLQWPNLGGACRPSSSPRLIDRSAAEPISSSLQAKWRALGRRRGVKHAAE